VGIVGLQLEDSAAYLTEDAVTWTFGSSLRVRLGRLDVVVEEALKEAEEQIVD
jgi:hypothetical protein